MTVEQIRVLVVDDEKIIRSSLEFYLEDEGFEVISADCGTAALALLEMERVHVGIFDMRMPDMDGNSLIIKVHQIYPHMKFLIYTGSTDYVLPEVITNIGVKQENVFIKPLVDMSLLARAIRYLVGEE